MTVWLVEHWLAVALFGLYTIALMYNALAGLSASKSLRGFYVGNRNLSGPLIGLSFFATFASTNSYIGHAGKGYEYGLAWMVMPFMLIVFTYISWRWIGPRTRLLARNFDALTLPDFLAARFLHVKSDGRHPLRVVAALVVMLCSLLYLVAIFKGAGHLFERFFNVPYQVAIGLALIVVMLYTSIGGFVSVVRTDALQGVLMMIGAVLIFYFVTRAAGGVGAISQLSAMPDKQFIFELNGGIPFVVLLGISLSGSLKLIVDPRQTSRFFALKDEAALRSGMWVAIVGPTSFYLSLVIQGDPPLGTLGSIVLLDVTFLSYYFFFRAWRVAREQLSGAHSLMLHGRLMSLGLLTTMSLLGQRMFVFAAVAARTAALLLLRRMPAAAAATLASLIESVLSDKAIFGISLMVTGAGYLGFVDGPRSPWLDWGFSKADEREMYGGEARADHRWRWRSRLLVFLVARGTLDWWRATRTHSDMGAGKRGAG